MLLQILDYKDRSFLSIFQYTGSKMSLPDQKNSEFTPEITRPDAQGNNAYLTPNLPRHTGPSILCDVSSSSTPQEDLRTPVKSLAQGYYFNGPHFSCTPTARPHLGLLSGGTCSPLLHTPGSGGAVSRTANLCKQKMPESITKVG